MTVRYLDTTGILVTDLTITKIEPVVNGSKLLLTGGTTFTIPIKDLVEITSA